MIFKNKKIGLLTVLGIAEQSTYRLETRTKCWVSKCQCGSKVIKTNVDLKEAEQRGIKEHCGCLHKSKYDSLAGLKFFSVTAIIRTLPITDNAGKKKATYFCKCDCGYEFNRDAANLLGHIKNPCPKCP